MGNKALTRRYFARLMALAGAGMMAGSLSSCSGGKPDASNDETAKPAEGAAASSSAEGVPATAEEPVAKAALPAGAVCVAEYAGNTLAVIDPATWQVVERIPAGQNPATVVLAAGSLYVGSSGGGEVAVVPVADPARATHIPVGTQPLGLCYDEPRGILYVGDYFNNSVHEVDVQLNSLVGTIRLDVCGYHKRTDPPDCCRIGPGEGRRTVAMALAPEGETLYCANYGTYDVARLNLEEGREIEAFDGVVGPRQMIVSHDGTLLYLAGVGGEGEQQVSHLYVVNRQTGKREQEVFVGQSVAGVAETPDGSCVLALARDEGVLVAFSSDWKETARLDVGEGADTLFLDAAGTTAYVANSATGVLTVVDVPALSVTAQAEGLASPKGIAVVE